MFSSLIHKYSCGVDFEVKHKADLLLSILFNIPKEHPYFEFPLILVCDMCYYARKINSFPRKGQFNKSRIFRTSQGKFNSFKEVRGG